ncbi:hypothetical protein F5146DRAFT_1116142 [Armillaria mellea]|nr:hypothetical protein F5146DRAFT_1116142 [Armillaria mellea]
MTSRDNHSFLFLPLMRPGEAPLSLEIFEKIIDYYSELDDKSTLLDCSHVCRAWVKRSRYHYFRKVSVYREERSISLLHMISEPRTSIVSSTIRELDVREHRKRNGSWVVRCLPLLLKALPGIKGLSLSCADYKPSSAYEFTQPSGRVLHRFPPQSLQSGITSLVFTSCCFQSLRQLSVVLNQFPSLEALVLEDLVFVDQSPGTLQPNFGEDRRVPHLARLKRLRIDTIPLNSSQDRLFFWFLYPMASVEMLSVQMPKELHGWKMLKQMLFGLRNSLLELELWESCDLYGDPNVPDLELKLSRVRTIIVSGIRPRRSDGSRTLKASMIPAIFYNIRESCELERVIFEVEDGDFIAAMEELKVPSKAIDQVLQQRTIFSSMKELVIRAKNQSRLRTVPIEGGETDKLFEHSVGRGVTLKMEY